MKTVVQQEAAEIAEALESRLSASSCSIAMLRGIAIVLIGLGLASCSSTKGRVDAPATARAVDLSRYAGRWFEIARLPMRFQKATEAAIAEYGSNFRRTRR
jgi:lipocalin